MLASSVAVALLLSLIVYALTGGADFGGGIWDLLATGPRAMRQRKAIAGAIAPIWEANHVWLILVVVVLFTGFPAAFAAMMTALNIPLTVMLVGIVLRGAAFIFRSHDSRAAAVQRHWSRVFGIASGVTPFCQGVILGALASGRIRLVEGQVSSGYLAGWLTPFALACGLFAVGLVTYLAATYLTLATNDQSGLQNDFRLRALWSGLSLFPVAGVAFFAARSGAPELFHGLTQGRAPWLMVPTALCAVGSFAAMRRRRFALARMAAVGQVALILVGGALAQYPYLITPDLTFANTQAPAATLRLLLIALAAGVVILLPSLAMLFWLFKSPSPR